MCPSGQIWALFPMKWSAHKSSKLPGGIMTNVESLAIMSGEECMGRKESAYIAPKFLCPDMWPSISSTLMKKDSELSELWEKTQNIENCMFWRGQTEQLTRSGHSTSPLIRGWLGMCRQNLIQAHSFKSAMRSIYRLANRSTRLKTKVAKSTLRACKMSLVPEIVTIDELE